jgi:ADP-heptose:LPS heptosyltransferase
MMKINGALFYLRLAIKKPGDAWEVLRALPKLVVQCGLLRKPVLLICRYSGMGDIICTFPSVAALKEQHPKSVMVYETRGHNVNLVRRCREVDLVVGEGSLLTMLLQRFLRPAQILFPALPDECKPPRPRERIHLIDEFRNSFGLTSLDKQSVQLKVSRRAARSVAKRLRQEGIYGKPFALLHTGPTWKVKEWPAEKWNELVVELKAKHQIEVIQIGENRTPYGEIREGPRVTGARNWVGVLTLDETLAALSVADLFLGVDSGVLHLAGTVNTPTIGIFGPTDPACFLPRNSRAVGVTSDVSCLGCHHNSQGPGHWQNGCPNNIQCMSRLQARDVFVACGKFLGLPQTIS